MVYINIAFLLFMICLSILSLQNSREGMAELNHKEHKLYFLYPSAWKLICITRLDRLLNKNTRVLDMLATLKQNDKERAYEKWYWCQKVAMVLFVLILFNSLSLLGWLSMMNSTGRLRDQYLIRPNIGEGESEINLKVILKDSKEETEGIIERLWLNIEEREYTQIELEEAFNKGIRYLEEKVLGKNVDKDKIIGDLNFITKLSGMGLRVDWRSENPKIIGKDGKVHNGDLPLVGVDVPVTAILSYKNQKKEHRMEFKVLPKPLSDLELIMRDVQKQLQLSSDDSITSSEWNLPNRVGDYSLSWMEIRKHPGTALTLLGMISAAILWLCGDKELQRKIDKRNAQLLLDYPELINKFTLLMNAGMTIKQAWIKITGDYIIQLEKGMTKERYVYEEMRMTVRELKLGIPEVEAYEKFGRRAGNLPYMRFGTLITQNLKKGSKGLSDLLNIEAKDAFAERKEHARRLGEEAGTKMLAPMMVMLMIVLTIIIVPAFMSFQF